MTQGTKTFTPEPKLGVVSFMGYFKISISFLKYLPQMYWNYKRKSTVGWSIANILLDFTGGFFSFLQMVLEAASGENIEINPVKLILGIMCMVYDIIFMIQHYCLYPERKRPDNALNEDTFNEDAINEEGKYSVLPEPQSESTLAQQTTPANPVSA